ncbi:MAG: hypothetical protein IJU08_02395 [Bacteroidales bacterium]|nr:hypothetical protein [Bacteroidales bacterium]
MKQNEDARVRLCEDGKYRWIYEMNMLTNPTIFLTVFKIFFYIILAGWLIFGTFLYLIHGDFAGFLDFSKGALIAIAGMAALTFLGVLLLSALYGGKYVVLFEMDEQEIKHIQLPRQVKKAQALSLLTALVGIAAKRPTTVGAGLLASGKTTSTSEYKKVRRVVARRALHLIKVNQLLEKNQIYVPDEDFDFVYEYIKSRCPMRRDPS